MYNPFFFFHIIADYLNRNFSFGQFLQHISKSIAVCARSRPKMLTTKKFVLLHDHCLLLTMLKLLHADYSV